MRTACCTALPGNCGQVPERVPCTCVLECVHVRMLARSSTTHLYTGQRDPPVEGTFAGQLACAAAVLAAEL
jgi:hypothetical protein